MPPAGRRPGWPPAWLVAGFAGGQVVRLTEGRYQTSATEVCATFREIDGVPQYMAVPQ